MHDNPFLPPFLPLNQAEDAWGHFEPIASTAIANLCKLDGMVEASPKADLFWLSWLMREAQSSNRIEGTITTLDEVFGENVGLQVPQKRKDDVGEVLNYREAMLLGLDYISSGRELSLSMIKELHARLLCGARGEAKQLGKTRTSGVAIGRPPVYIPPSAEHVPSLLENLELFLRRKDINPLIQAAVLHAQFEMIHPFLDGNGRIGRLLITLQLAQQKLITMPCFYLSAYLQDRREDYYQALNNISANNDWRTWIEFFLEGVIAKSQANITLLRAMTALYEESKTSFAQITGSSHAMEFLDYMYKNPLFSLPALKAQSGIKLSSQTIKLHITKMNAAGILDLAFPKIGRKAAIWRFTALMRLIGG